MEKRKRKATEFGAGWMVCFYGNDGAYWHKIWQGREVWPWKCWHVLRQKGKKKCIYGVVNKLICFAAHVMHPYYDSLPTITFYHQTAFNSQTPFGYLLFMKATSLFFFFFFNLMSWGPISSFLFWLSYVFFFFTNSGINKINLTKIFNNIRERERVKVWSVKT